MDIKQIIEQINLLTEEEKIEEEILQDTPAAEPEVEPAINDSMSLADTFDTKAKIARCLDTLKQAIEEFKVATAEKIDLLKDASILAGQEKLDAVVAEIEQALANGTQLLGDSELNDAFKAELPQENITEEPAESAEETKEEEEKGVVDFDSEAGLNLFPAE